MQLSDRQQKLLLGFEILNRAEQRLEILQKFQIELTQKEVEVKAMLANNDLNSSPENVERFVGTLGTTRANEARDNRRRMLESERSSLQTLLSQIGRTLSETDSELRQTEAFVKTLRQKILPQIELEISDL